MQKNKTNTEDHEGSKQAFLICQCAAVEGHTTFDDNVL